MMFRRRVAQFPSFPMGGPIPRILHQHFLLGESAIPDRIRPIRDALRAANPDWTYSFWDAERAERWIADTYGRDVLARYLRIAPEYYAARSDLLRYLNLYALGGVYLDIKSTCDRPLDEAIRPEDRFLVLPWNRDSARPIRFPELEHIDGGVYVQWAIASTQGHPILRGVIESVLHNVDAYSARRFGAGKPGTLRMSGPIAYTLAVEALRTQHPHTYLAAPSARGFRYSALEAGDSHFGLFGTHYTELKTPVVTPSRLEALLIRALRFLKRMPLIATVVERLRNVPPRARSL